MARPQKINPIAEEILEMPDFPDKYWELFEIRHSFDDREFVVCLIAHFGLAVGSGLSLDLLVDKVKTDGISWTENQIETGWFHYMSYTKPSKSIKEAISIIEQYSENKLTFPRLAAGLKALKFSKDELVNVQPALDLLDRNLKSATGLYTGFLKVLNEIKQDLFKSGLSKEYNKLSAQLTATPNKNAKAKLIETLASPPFSIKAASTLNRHNPYPTKEPTTDQKVKKSLKLLKVFKNLPPKIQEKIDKLFETEKKRLEQKKRHIVPGDIYRRLISSFTLYLNTENQYVALVELCTKVINKHYRQYLMDGQSHYEHYPIDLANEVALNVWRKGAYNHTLSKGEKWEFLKQETGNLISDMKKTSKDEDGLPWIGLGSTDKSFEYSRNYFSVSYGSSRMNGCKNSYKPKNIEIKNPAIKIKQYSPDEIAEFQLEYFSRIKT